MLVFRPELTDTFMTGDPNQMNMADPWLLVLLFGSVAIWLPIALFARWVMRPRPMGLIWSVTGRLRWRGLIPLALAGAVILVALRHEGPVVHAVLNAGPLKGGVAVPRPRLAPAFPPLPAQPARRRCPRRQTRRSREPGHGHARP